MKLFFILSACFISSISFAQRKGVGTYLDWNNKICIDSVMEVKAGYDSISVDKYGVVSHYFTEPKVFSIIPFKGNLILPFQHFISAKFDN